MKFIKKLYFTNTLFIILAGLVMVFVVGFFWPLGYAIAKVSLLAVIVALIADYTAFVELPFSLKVNAA